MSYLNDKHGMEVKILQFENNLEVVKKNLSAPIPYKPSMSPLALVLAHENSSLGAWS